MAADREDLISQYIDESAIKEQTDFFLSQLKSILDLYDKLNATKLTFNKPQSIADTSNATKDMKTNLDALAKSTDVLTSIQAKQAAQAKSQAQQIDNTTKSIQNQTSAIKQIVAESGVTVVRPSTNAGAESETNGVTVQQPKPDTTLTVQQTSALKDLNAQYKLLVQNTKDAILNYGAESDQAKAAADAENFVKERIDSLITSYKNLINSKRENNDIPFTTNVSSSGNIVQPQEGNISGTVVSNEELANTQKQLDATKELIAEKQKVISITEQDASAISDYAQKVGLAGKSYEFFSEDIQQNIRTQQSYKTQLDDITKSIEQNENEFNKGAIPFNTYKDNLINLVTQQKGVQQSSNDLNKTIDLQVKAYNSDGTSLQGLNAQYELLYNIFKKLSSEQQQSSGGQALQKDLGDLKNQINDLQKSAGNFSANVGRYFQDLGGPLNVLKSQLQAIKDQLAATAKTDPGFNKLSQEEQLLTGLTQKLQGGFVNAMQETRGLNTVAQALGETFGIASKEFQDFVTAAGVRENEIKNIQKTIEFQSSNTRYLDGILNAVNGVVSAYGALNAAQALFGDGSKQSAEEAQKFQEILTLVVSVQQLFNVISKESATVQTALAARTAILTAAQKINAAVRAALTTSTQAAVAADTELASVETAVAEATVAGTTAMQAQATVNAEAAVSTEALGTSMVAEAAGAEAATTATTGFATALTATGIVAVIAAIGAGIIYLINKMSDSAKAFQENIDIQKAFADVADKTNAVLKEQADYVKNLSQSTIDYYNNQLKFSQSAGENQEKQFALQKKINQATKQQADATVESLGASYNQQAKLTTQLQGLDDQKQKALEGLQKTLVLIQQAEQSGQGHGNLDAIKDAFQQQLDLFNVQYSSIKTQYDTGQQALKDQENANTAIQEQSVQETKYAADEKRKLVLAESEIEVDDIKNKNSIILNDERSTLDQRLSAIKSNAAAEKQLLQAQTNDVLQNPGSSDNDKIIAQEKLASGIKKINEDLNQSLFDINQQYRLKDLDAQADIQKQSIQLNADKNNQIASDDTKAFDVRIAAYKKYIDDQKAIADAEFANQLAHAGASDLEIQLIQEGNKIKLQSSTLTDKQLEELEQTHQNKIISINEDGAQKITALTRQEIENQKQLITQLNSDVQNIYQAGIASTANDIAAKFANQQANIKNQFAAGIIDQQEMQKQLRDSTIALQKETAQAFISSSEQQLKTLNPLSEEWSKLNNAIADAKNTLAGFNVESKNNGLADLQNKLQNIADVINNIAQAFTTVGNIPFDQQKQDLENLSQQQDALYQREQTQINDSILSNDEKYKRLQILDSKHAADQDAIAAKQKQIDIQKAQFDKAANIANIITTTALAIVKALATGGPFAIPLAATIGALGAAELAAAIATPVPTYRHGTKDHPGGPAVVGDAGKKEIIKTPDNKIFISPAKSTLVNLPKHTIVYPDADKFLKTVYNLTSPSIPMYDKTLSSERIEFETMTKKLEKRLSSIEQTIANKKENHYYVTPYGLLVQQRDQQNQIDYLNDNFQF